MPITIYSFSYRKKPWPPNSPLFLDCRVLPNPHNDPKLRPLDGRSADVQNFLKQNARTMGLIERGLQGLRNGHAVAFGCYGGRHRSVALAELLAVEARAVGISVHLEHLSLD